MSDAPPSSLRRRLVFLSGLDEHSLEYFRISSIDPLRHWLRLHFDMVEVRDTIIVPDQIVAEHAPEMILMLSTERGLTCELGTTDQGPPFGDALPVAAITLMDADSPAKATLFAQLARHSIDALFTVDSSLAGLAPPELRKRIIYTPWFVNEAYCRDFELEKTMPIGLFGEGFAPTGEFFGYPWRAGVGRVVRRRYPCLSVPTPNAHVAPHRFVGEEYARLLNRTQVAMGCGGARQIMVKKQLEIPACGTCLVTEDSPVLRQLGFRDMENCVFVDEENVAEKLDHLFAHPERIAEITRQGYEFVRSKHTPAARDTVVRWLEAKLAGVEPEIDYQLAPDAHRDSPFWIALQSGIDALCDAGDHQTAHERFSKARRFSARSPELTFFIGACHLLDDRPGDTVRELDVYLRTALRWHAVDPDPAMWGLYLLAQHALGHEEIAGQLARTFPNTRHPLLDAARVRAGFEIAPADYRSPSFLLPEGSEWDELTERLLSRTTAAAPGAQPEREPKPKRPRRRFLGRKS